jgi:glycosyltransferase involved in cell wall biosynthesis
MRHDCDVSVLVTAYNQTRILPVVLKCLASQSYGGSWEIIVCDDGSEDNTLNVVENASSALGVYVRYVWHPRSGERRAAVRNKGLLCAKGHLIICIDGDIAVRPDFISNHVANHAASRTIVYGTRRWLFLGDLPKGAPIEPIVELLLLNESDNSPLHCDLQYQQMFAASTCPWLACMGCNFSFVRGVEAVLFDEHFVGWGCEDQEFACRLHSQYGYRFQFSRAIDVLHLDERSRKDFVPLMRPRSHSDIVGYTRNLIHFCDSYPQFDASVICRGLGLFEIDPEHGLWRRAKRPKFDREHICSLLAVARNQQASIVRRNS